MGVEPLIALPPRVLVAGRLQCGAARAGVRRGHGECAELAHLAPRLDDRFVARHRENGPFSCEVGTKGWLAPCRHPPQDIGRDRGISSAWLGTHDGAFVAPLQVEGLCGLLRSCNREPLLLEVHRPVAHVLGRHDGQTPTGKYKVPGWTHAALAQGS